MAKTPTPLPPDDIREMFANQNVIDVEIRKEMKTAFMEYAMSVIVARALPDVRDGLKPIHRRIIYTMYEDNLTPDRPFHKSAATVGDVMAKYHPHGDASIYDALVRMAQPFSLRYPLVQGQGNFGNVDGDPPAAQRYTEARMSRMATELVRDIEKETVGFIPSYDGRNNEPTVLPTRFPQLLVNGATGIAVGMATSIPPHNLREVIDATIALLDNPEIGIEGLLQYIEGPDFPTGGIVMGRSGLRAAYFTGRGKLTVRAKTEIETVHDRERIVVTELPYMVNKSRLLSDIADHVNSKRIEGIYDLRDESDRNGMSIVIELKKDANAQVVLNQLFKNTQLQDTYSAIMIALVDQQPRVLNLKQILEHYVSYQEEIITKRTQYDLKKALERAHILEGLLKALDHIDEVIRIIRASKTIADAKTALMEAFDFSDIQAQRIVDMRLGQLTGLERDRLLEEYNDLEKKIADYRDILASETRVKGIIKTELAEIRDKYGDDRRTAIEEIDDEIDIEDLIEEKTCVYTLTNKGYIKRLSEENYKVQRRGGKGVTALTTREEDVVEEIFTCSTHDRIMFFTSFGRVYCLKGYEIPESNRQAKGMNIVNLLQLFEGEKVTAMIPMKRLDEEGYFTMVTQKGISKRCRVTDFKNIRRAGLNAVGLDEGDALVTVRLTDGTKDMIVATSAGMAIRYSENDVRVMGRTARGVRVIKLGEGEKVVGAAVVEDGKSLITVTENGFGKRTSFDAFNGQNRGGKGVRVHKISDKTGALTSVRSVSESDDMVIISSDGIIIRVHIADIPVYGRASAGVRVMRFGDDTKVIATAVINADEDDGNAVLTEVPEAEEAENEDTENEE
ncbi:MAG: DNA gyrase subunit A [Clostridia bacterium]|nr:DNA gyrase subunit A [Clostridia bacterium]